VNEDDVAYIMRGSDVPYTRRKGALSSRHETSGRNFDSEGPRNPTQTSRTPVAGNPSDNAPAIGQETPNLEAFTSHRLAQAILMAFGMKLDTPQQT
jgi:hypothetical protein